MASDPLAASPSHPVSPWVRRRKPLIIVIVVTVIVALLVPRIWLYLELSSARRALSSGHPETALRKMVWVAHYAPDVAEVQYLLAVAQRRTGHLELVQTSLTRAQKLGWNKEEIERQTMLLIAQSGEVDAVHGRLKAMMVRGASDDVAQEIYEALAIGFLKSYRLREAWECLNFWSEWQPKAIFPKYWRADICRRIENPTAEEQEYRDILAIDPRHLNSRIRLAEVLKDTNRVEDAAREFETALGQDSTRPDALIGQAECQRRLGNVNQAAALLQTAMKLDLTPVEKAAALTQLGQIDADAGRPEQAVSSLEEAVRLAPFEAATIFALSQAYTLVGDEQKSQEALDRSKRVRSQRDRIEEIARILVDRPGSADLRYETAKILMDLGMKDDGAAWLKTALQMQPDFEPARAALEDYTREKAKSTVESSSSR